MAVYLQISGNFDSQIKSPCLAKPESIWSKKPMPVEMLSLSCSVQIQCHLDLCLFVTRLQDATLLSIF